MRVGLHSCRSILALAFLLILVPCRAQALTVDVISLGNDRLQVTLDDILQREGRVYSLDRASGQVSFGDGNQGTRPPSGRSGVIGAYRFGEGGAVFNEFDLLDANLPLPISLAALLDPKDGEDKVNFVLAGIQALKFELNREQLIVLSARAAVVPLPPSAALMLSALIVLGIAGYRRQGLSANFRPTRAS